MSTTARAVVESDRPSPVGLDRRFAKNSVWSFAALSVNVFVALALSPFILKQLGDQRYGLWTLIFTLLDYLWFFDFGFMSAIANQCARHYVKGDNRRVNEVVNTATFYFSIVAVVIWFLTAILFRKIEALFQIPPEHRAEFSYLVLMTGLAWGICAIMQVYLAALDGFQRFDLSGRVSMVVVILRSTMYMVLLQRGFGLVAMGGAFVVCQIGGYLLHFVNFRRCFPEFQFSRKMVHLTVLRDIASYGVHTFVASVSNLCLNQSSPLLIGHFLAPRFVSYATLPVRLMQNAVDAISRIAIVTRSRVAEINEDASGCSVIGLAVYINRYCFALFAPLAIFLFAYGEPLIRLWLGPVFAINSAPLLPWLLFSNLIAFAGQFNTGATLFGLSRHRGYARCLLAEGILNVAGLCWVIPRRGILGGAILSSILMLFFRSLCAPYLLCRGLEYSYWKYMREIYTRPILVAIPVLILIEELKRFGINGTTWWQLLSVGLLTAVLYLGTALMTCLAGPHRAALLSRITALTRTRSFGPVV